MTAHVCKPRPETESALRDGSRSSMREVCPICQTANTFIQTIFGTIVVLDARGRRK